MGVYYESGDRELWNPSLDVSRMFLGQMRVLEEFVGRPSGVGTAIEDEVRVDIAALRTFLETLDERMERSRSPHLRSMVHGAREAARMLVGETEPPTRDRRS